jgi:flagellar biosynthesis protein FliR
MNEFGSLAGVAVLLVRPGMLVMATPFLGALNTPVQMRVGLTVLLAVLLASGAAVQVTLPATGMVVVILREMFIGLAIAMAIRALLAGAEFAGDFLGYQIGLSLGSLIDPQSGVSNNILALLYGNLVAVICLATNVHHDLIRALGDSYTALPIGLGGVDGTLGIMVGRLLGMVFVIGLRISAPVVVVLLLVELALGLVGRVAPSLNVISTGAPIRIVAGLLVLAASLSALPTLVARYVPAVLSLGADTARAFR